MTIRVSDQAKKDFLSAKRNVLFRDSFCLPKAANVAARETVTVTEVMARGEARGSTFKKSFKYENYGFGKLLSEITDLSPGEISFAAVDSRHNVQGLIRLYAYADTSAFRVFVSQIDKAPWNFEIHQASAVANPDFDPEIALKGIGSVLLSSAIQVHFRLAQSINKKAVAVYGLGCISADPFFNAIGLHSLKDAPGIGFTDPEAFEFLNRTISRY